MTTALSHRSRSPRANKVRAAAVDHDVERLQQEVTALLDAFVDHTNEERAHLVRLPTFTAEQVDETCRCEQLGTIIAVRLTLQVDAERRPLTRAASPSTSRSPSVRTIPEVVGHSHLGPTMQPLTEGWT